MAIESVLHLPRQHIFVKTILIITVFLQEQGNQFWECKSKFQIETLHRCPKIHTSYTIYLFFIQNHLFFEDRHPKKIRGFRNKNHENLIFQSIQKYFFTTQIRFFRIQSQFTPKFVKHCLTCSQDNSTKIF